MNTYQVKAIDATTSRVEWAGIVRAKTEAAAKAKVTRLLGYDRFRIFDMVLL